MHSKITCTGLASTVVISLLISGCGVFGQKPPFDRNILFKSASAGCLNGFGKQFENFLTGEVETQAWDKTWDCIDNTLNQFKTFARGSDAQGYTDQDIKMLLQTFLITNKTVTDEFVRSNLELKSALLGGSPSLISYQELQRLRDLLKLLKKETGLLIPYMKARRFGTDPQALIRMSQAVETSGIRLGKFFESYPQASLHKESVRKLLTQLSQVFGWNLDTDIVDPAFAFKSAVIAGSVDTIEGSALNRVFQLGATAAGAVLAVKGYNGDSKSELIADLIRAHESTTFQVLAWQGGVIRHEKLNEVINHLPESWKAIEPEVLRKTVRNISKKILFSVNPDGFDYGSIQTLYRFIDEWKRGGEHVKAIFKLFPASSLTVTKEVFLQKAMDYLTRQERTTDQNLVKKIIELSQKYRPMFEPGEDEMKFQAGLDLSQTHMSKVFLFALLAEHLMKAYAANPNGQGYDSNGITVEQFKVFFDDFMDFAGQLNLIDTTTPNTYLKRFREADLFTFASNGNERIDIDEGIYYVGVIASSFSLSRRLREDTEAVCKLPDESQDKLEWYWQDIKCFRKIVRDNIGTYFKMFPMLKNYFNLLSKDAQTQLLNNMEKGYRLNGNTDVPTASYDIRGLAGYLHYIEALFLKYDVGGNGPDQVLDKKEILKAFPTFSKLLQAAAKSNGLLSGIFGKKKVLEAIFTYVIRFGKKPDKDLKTKIHFMVWLVGRPFWKIKANRGNIYAIVPILLAPPPSPPTTGSAQPIISDEELEEIERLTPDEHPDIDPDMFAEEPSQQ